MPTYEYQCTKCERIFEEFHGITAKPLRTIATDCDQCNNKAPVQRLIGSGAGVIFKGSGFYETDYRSESYKAAKKAEKDGGSGDKSADKGKNDTTAGKKKESTKSSPADGPSTSAKSSTKKTD
ncbi:MAG: zinc ribbon domain-containing protein [bacterium]|nr:zinc ribbon domain-containing protein [bacterium]